MTEAETKQRIVVRRAAGVSLAAQTPPAGETRRAGRPTTYNPRVVAAFVEAHTQAHGAPPTVAEIATTLGLTEKTVHYLVERHGIAYQPRRRRTVASEAEVVEAIRTRQKAMGGNSPTVGELAEALNLHPARVRRWLVTLEKSGRLRIIDRLTYRVILEET